MLRLGVVGYGYWGPNLARNFHAQPDCRVVAVCDRDPRALARASAQHPGVATTVDAADVLASPDIDAVAIATPVSTHYALARAALDHGKHVFVEKPFTAAAAEAEDLIARADRGRRVLMVDHTFLFTSAARDLRDRSAHRGRRSGVHVLASGRARVPHDARERRRRPQRGPADRHARSSRPITSWARTRCRATPAGWRGPTSRRCSAAHRRFLQLLQWRCPRRALGAEVAVVPRRSCRRSSPSIPTRTSSSPIAIRSRCCRRS